MRNGWKLFFVAAALVACGPVAVQEGGGGGTPTPTPTGTATPTPTPVVSPPPMTGFAPVETILEGKTCGQASCHGTTATPAGGLSLKLPPLTADATYNYNHITCSSPFDTYNPPAGHFVSYFCTDATTPTTGHNGNVYSAGDCTAIYNWAMTGGTGTNLAVCPAP